MTKANSKQSSRGRQDNLRKGLKMWKYQSKKGVLWIKKNRDGRYDLGVESECLGSYNSPQSAADDVFCCVTGYGPWDDQGTVDQPTDLGEWEKVA